METNVHIRLIVSRGIKKTPYQKLKINVSQLLSVTLYMYTDDMKKKSSAA